MDISKIKHYARIGEDVMENCIKHYTYITDSENPTYTQIIRNYGPSYSRTYAGGYFEYSVDSNGNLTVSCNGNHTQPWCYMYIDGTYGYARQQAIIQDAHYHLSGCPAGGSKDTYFLYVGPLNYYQTYDAAGDISKASSRYDMGFNPDNIDTGEGKDIDLRCSHYYHLCDIGDKLVDGGGTPPGGTRGHKYTVTETGLHLDTNDDYPYTANLYFVVMPGTALDHLVIPKPKLVKTAEAYYKGDDAFGRPLAFSPISGYSYGYDHGLRIDYDWNTDQYHIYGNLDKQGDTSNIIWTTGRDWTHDGPSSFTLGHQYELIPFKIISSNDDRIGLYWYIYSYALIEEQNESHKSKYMPLGDYTWMIQYYSYPTNIYNPVPPGEPYVYYQSIYDDRYDSPYQKPQDSYKFTIQKQKYAGSSDYRTGNSSWELLIPNEIPEGTYIDVYLQAPRIQSLSGPERPKPPGPNPDPPPPRPEPSKPAEPDTAWNIGTSFVIGKDGFDTGILDNYESLIWNEVYNDIGDFEVYTCVDDDILKLAKPGNMITRNDSDKIMIIESVKITTDVETGNHITVKGRSIESLLDRRIIWEQTTVSGSVHDAIKKLITEAIIEPKNECRKIENFIFEDSDDPAVLQYQMDEAQFDGESLLESIKKICDIFHLGFKVYMNEQGKYAFKLYAGTDRSYYQEDLPYVIFSHNFGNLLDSEFITDSYNYKTTMLVMSDVEDEAIKTKKVTIGDGYSGMNRREISYKSSTSPNKESGAGKYTNEEFARMLNEDGTRQLTEYKTVNQFQGSADIHQMYIYGEDFFLGDVVQIVDEFGNSACSRVNRLVISHDSNGIYSYPEFEVFERGNKIKISTGSMDVDNPSINVKYNDSLTTEHFASEYSTEYTPLYELIGIAYEAVQEKSFTIKSLKRVMFRGKIYDENTVLATFPFNVFTDLEVNEYIDEEETYS